ncbi:hypothetical protein FRC07_006761 [Ceratobasidium sp. 392]|nr:hypothetical protein FRC07_006761 [Ceratobasidium sp. 392]
MSTGPNELIEQFLQYTTDRRVPRPPLPLLHPAQPRLPSSLNPVPVDSLVRPDLDSPNDDPVPFEPVPVPTPPLERNVGYTPPTQTTLRSGRVSGPHPAAKSISTPAKPHKRLGGAHP